MTIDDHEGLSHPHTNNGFFPCPPLNASFILEKKRGKDFQKILNRMRCDTVTSFLHYNDVTDGCAAVRFSSLPRAGTGV